MLDRSNFTTPPLEVHRDAVLAYKDFGCGIGLPLMTASTFASKGQSQLSARISPLADDMVLLHLFQRDGRWFLRACEFNPSKLLDGHNGRLVSTPQRLCASLSELQSVIEPFLVNPAGSDLVIPGSGKRATGHWTRMEIAADLPDPNGALLRASQNCRHRSITKPAFSGKNGSRKLPGTNLQVNFYLKDQEMKRRMKKFDAPREEGPILRIEFTLKADKLSECFQKARSGRLVEKRISGTSKSKLTAFRVRDLREVHRFLADQLQGFFRIPMAKNIGVTDHAAFIAQLAKEGCSNADVLMNKFNSISGGDRNTRSRLRGDVMKAISAMSDLLVGDVLSDDAYANQPGISIPKLEHATKQQWRKSGTNPLITAAYGGEGLGERRFVPHVYLDDLVDHFPFATA